MIYCHHLVKKKEVSVKKVLQTFRLVIRTWLYLQWSLSCWLKSGRNGAATIATAMENKVGEKKTTKRNSDSNKLTKNCLHCSAHVCLCWAILLIGPSACGWKPRENVTNIGTKRSSSRSFFFPLFLRPLSSPPIRKTAAEMPQENQPLCEMECWMKAADGNCTCSLGFLSGPRSPGTVIKPLASIVASYRGDKKRGMKKKVQGRTGEKIWFRFLCGCLEGRRRWRIISIHHRHNPDVIRQYGQTDFRADIADIGLLLFMAAIDRRADWNHDSSPSSVYLITPVEWKQYGILDRGFHSYIQRQEGGGFC